MLNRWLNEENLFKCAVENVILTDPTGGNELKLMDIYVVRSFLSIDHEKCGYNKKAVSDMKS